MAYAKIRPRRGTLYEWNSVNPVIAEGEMVIEVPETGVGTGLCKFKIGDGFTKYADLPYAFDGEVASSIVGGNASEFNVIAIRSGTTEEWLDANPILAENEITFDKTTKYIKIGDGVSAWSELPYVSELPVDYDFGDEDEMSTE